MSVCDTSWARMTGQELRQQQLVRTPSQANNLCTTVPQSLVVQNLGGRHTPTRSSLRHSRMIVLSKNGKGEHRRAAAAEFGKGCGRGDTFLYRLFALHYYLLLYCLFVMLSFY